MTPADCPSIFRLCTQPVSPLCDKPLSVSNPDPSKNTTLTTSIFNKIGPVIGGRIYPWVTTPSIFCPLQHPCVLNNRPFAASHSRGTKPPRWGAKIALGQDKQKTYITWNGNFLCLPSPSATFSLQHGGFVPREWLAVEGLFVTSNTIVPAKDQKETFLSAKYDIMRSKIYGKKTIPTGKKHIWTNYPFIIYKKKLAW